MSEPTTKLSLNLLAIEELDRTIGEIGLKHSLGTQDIFAALLIIILLHATSDDVEQTLSQNIAAIKECGVLDAFDKISTRLQ